MERYDNEGAARQEEPCTLHRSGGRHARGGGRWRTAWALAQLVDYNDISPVRKLHAGDQLLVNNPAGIFLTAEYPHHTVQPDETLDSLGAASVPTLR